MKLLKKHLAFIIALVMVLSLAVLCVSASQPTYGGGDGTQESPYLISSAEHLTALAGQVNNGSSQADVYFKLTEDISLNYTTDWKTWSADVNPQNEWTPIGTASNSFAGTFDGNGNTISGVYASGTEYIGLFGNVSGTVKNLTVDKSFIYSSSSYSGGIAGAVTGSVIGCANYATVVNGNLQGGGIAGNCINGIVSKCVNYGTISGTQQVGGIVGGLGGTVTQCVNNGEVSGTKFVGGIVGIAGASKKAGLTSNCVNLGEIQSSGDSAGGIVGRYGNVAGCDIKDCLNIGQITANSYAGAIFGSSKSGNSVTTSNNYYDSTTSSASSYGANNSGVSDATAYGTAELKGACIVSKLGFDTKYWMNTEGYPMLKVFDAYNTSFTGYQFTSFEEGYCDLRFIAVVNDKNNDGSLDDEYTAVGFEIEMTAPKSWNNKIEDGAAPAIKTVYTSVMEGGKSEATTADELCGDYIFVSTVSGIKQNVGTVTFTVKVFHDDLDGVRHYDDSFVVNYNTGSAS